MFYLQCADNEANWEEVDEYTFLNATKAIGTEDKPRYTGKGIIEDGNNVMFYNGKLAVSWSKEELGRICRLCGVKSDLGTVPGGFCRNPEFVKFKIRNSVSLHEINGGTFKLTTRAKSEEEKKDEDEEPQM